MTCGPGENVSSWDISLIELICYSTNDPMTAPSTSQDVVIRFGKGIPVKVSSNGQEVTDSLELFTFLNEIGKLHGIGRIDIVEVCTWISWFRDVLTFKESVCGNQVKRVLWLTCHDNCELWSSSFLALIQDFRYSLRRSSLSGPTASEFDLYTFNNIRCRSWLRSIATSSTLRPWRSCYGRKGAIPPRPIRYAFVVRDSI